MTDDDIQYIYVAEFRDDPDGEFEQKYKGDEAFEPVGNMRDGRLIVWYKEIFSITDKPQPWQFKHLYGQTFFIHIFSPEYLRFSKKLIRQLLPIARVIIVKDMESYELSIAEPANDREAKRVPVDQLGLFNMEAGNVVVR